ncbi:MAG: adenine phosphoribosyltransferase [Prochlorococcus marinus CUG1435]|nr:adenine phosphoribosyltransferase [Prochlorococcus marinus CUG1435]
MDFHELIETHNDFPKKGIKYKDVLPILRSPDNFSCLIEKMSDFDFFKKSDAIIAIDARGFIFGSGIALKLQKPLVLARKPGKLPGELISSSYNLEYGQNTLCIQKDGIRDFSSFAIVDDLLATGGTVGCVAKLLKSQKKIITGLAVVVQLIELKGKLKFNFPTSAILSI